MKNIFGMDIEEPPVEDGLSKQEQDYILDMAESSRKYFDASAESYAMLREVFRLHRKEEHVHELYQLLIKNTKVSHKLHQWSQNNFDMTRFPSSKDELKSARDMSFECSGDNDKLMHHYNEILVKTAYLQGLEGLGRKLSEMRVACARMGTLTFRAYGAVSRDGDCIVDPTLLHKMPNKA